MVNRLLDTLMPFKFGKSQRFAVTLPVRLLLPTLNSSKLVMFDMLDGIEPLRSLKLTSNTVTLFNRPISSGRGPDSELLSMMISFRVLDMLPMLVGIVPVKWLLAKTTTDTGDSPRFSGMLLKNMLLLTNNASRRLEKSFPGR